MRVFAHRGGKRTQRCFANRRRHSGCRPSPLPHSSSDIPSRLPTLPSRLSFSQKLGHGPGLVAVPHRACSEACPGRGSRISPEVRGRAEFVVSNGIAGTKKLTRDRKKTIPREFTKRRLANLRASRRPQQQINRNLHRQIKPFDGVASTAHPAVGGCAANAAPPAFNQRRDAFVDRAAESFSFAGTRGAAETRRGEGVGSAS